MGRGLGGGAKIRPLRPLFGRHNSSDELERDAERLKNRDWVEFLRVLHPSQAEEAEREYLLARLSQDWGELTSPLLATHSLPETWNGKSLIVACDHNTFANELSLIAPVVEKKIAARYAINVKIIARASRRIDWAKKTTAPLPELKNTTPKTPPNPVLEKLISEIERFE